MICAKVGESKYFFQSDSELYFNTIKENIIGNNACFSTPYGKQKILYADWTASGRLYKKVEEMMMNEIGPYIANTHTESNFTGTFITNAYNQAKQIIKQHVNANEKDILIFDGFGMTSVVNKLQRLLGLKKPKTANKKQRPIIFVTHMEHHSNYLSWLETCADVEMIHPTSDGDVDLFHLEELLESNKDRQLKIGAFTACSNVTGRKTNYHALAALMHQYNGMCFVDFSASAPYVKIDMHPIHEMEKLDAIYFSPHKFLGGPGSSGVLIMHESLLNNSVPDNPGGGTVDFTNQWGDILYKKNREEREDAGTPGFLQAIKTSLCIQLKEEMGIKKIEAREQELVELTMLELEKIQGITILDGENKNRLGIISIICHDIHYDLLVRILNDRFGIQVRGGCSCAGPYGHFLLGINEVQSKQISISEEIKQGIEINKPGWVRISLHPTMSNQDVYTIVNSIKKIMIYKEQWKHDYIFNQRKNSYDRSELHNK